MRRQMGGRRRKATPRCGPPPATRIRHRVRRLVRQQRVADVRVSGAAAVPLPWPTSGQVRRRVRRLSELPTPIGAAAGNRRAPAPKPFMAQEAPKMAPQSAPTPPAGPLDADASATSTRGRQSGCTGARPDGHGGGHRRRSAGREMHPPARLRPKGGRGQGRRPSFSSRLRMAAAIKLACSSAKARPRSGSASAGAPK